MRYARFVSLLALGAVCADCGGDNTEIGKTTNGGAGGSVAGTGGNGGAGGSGGTLTSGSGGSSGSGAAPGCPGVAAPPQSAGTTYYVSPSGSDSAAGSQAAPFATIQKAVDTVAPGDSVIVADGTYTGAPGVPIATLTKGGSAGNFVWLRSEHKWGAKLDGQKSSSDGFRLENGIGWVRIQDFEIFGAGIDGASSGISCDEGGHDSEIIGNHIYDIGGVCTDTSNGLVGIFVRQPSVSIEANVIHNIGRTPASGTSTGCQPTTQHWLYDDPGILVSGAAPGASGVMIKNNFLSLLFAGPSVALSSGPLGGVSILNNSFATPNQTGSVGISCALSNSRFENNVSFHNGPAPIALLAGSSFSSFVVDANLTTESQMVVGPTPSGITLMTNYVGQSAQLVNVANDDLHLIAGSPGIDQGNALSAVPLDFDGCTRPQGSGYDIGADELAP